MPDFKIVIRGAGYYHDTYRRDADGAWRIASTDYERIYEAMTSLEDTPSLQADREPVGPVAEALTPTTDSPGRSGPSGGHRRAQTSWTIGWLGRFGTLRQ